MGERYTEKGKKIPLIQIGKYIKEINEVLSNQQMALRELEEYSSEIKSVMDSYNKKSAEETMMVKGFRKSDQETINRKTHQENLANIAVRIAKGINKKEYQQKRVGLNCDIIDIMAKNHDIGHTFLGHSGEWWLSNIKEDYGMGYYCHNALGARELIYTNKVYDQIIDTIKQSDPEVGEKTLNRVRKNLWLIMDGINAHNGERSESEYIPDVNKTESDFERENLYCYTKKGFDRTILPATPEAALMRLCDKISYIPYDMIDGLREGFITDLNEEYRVILRKLGITDDEIEEIKLSNHYEQIARKLQTVFINDVIKNSTGTVIRMSEGTSKLLHELRNINNRQIVDFVVLKEDNETYPPAIRELMNQMGEIVEEEDLLTQLRRGEIDKDRKKELLEKYKGTPYEDFIRYTYNTNQDDFNYTVKIIEEATRQSIADEQEKARDIVKKREPFSVSKDFSIRDERIKRYIAYYQNKDLENYTEEDREQDIEKILENINNPDKKSDLYISMNRRIALEMGAKYIASLNDIEFMTLLRNTGKVDEKQYKSLTRTYKRINSLSDEVYVQANWRVITTEQAKSTDEK